MTISRKTTTSRRHARLRLIAQLVVTLTAAVGYAGCDRKTPNDPDALASISVTPNPQTLAIGGTQQFTATGINAGSGAVQAVTPVWSVVSGGGTITTTGLFTAGNSMGTFMNTVRAVSGDLTATATIQVIAGPIATIVVSPNPSSLSTGATAQFTAVATDAGGNVVAFTPTWSVIAGGGTISGSGLFSAGFAAGAFANTVQASNGTTSGTASVTVLAGALARIEVTPNPASLAIGAAQQFTAVGKDAAGNVVPVTPQWSVTDGGGTITTGGLFTAGTTTGTFTNTVRAVSGTIIGTATVTVTGGPLVTLVVSPDPATLAFGGTQQFTAVGRDAAGNVVTVVPTWSVTAGGGTIGASGLFTAGSTAGTFTNTVRATSGAISGSATVIVTAPGPVLATITVTPDPASVTVNATRQFTATGRDANGAVVAINPVWSVTNSGGTINANSGLFTAGATAGTFNNTVRATSGGISGNATVTVQAVVQPPIVDLGAASLNGIMAGTAVTCVIGGRIEANVAISPGNTITGFGPCVITGVRHLADAVAEQGQIDLTRAYNTLAGLPCPPANAIVANLGGTTKTAGVYCTASGISVSGTLTLDGGNDPNATFVFQAGTSLTTAGSIVLINGAQAANVYWQVGSSATIGTASAWQGNILALTSISMLDNATLLGRALARNGAVSLTTGNSIILP